MSAFNKPVLKTSFALTATVALLGASLSPSLALQLGQQKPVGATGAMIFAQVQPNDQAAETMAEPAAEILAELDAPVLRGKNTDGSVNYGTESTAANFLADYLVDFAIDNGIPVDFAVVSSTQLQAELDPNLDGKITEPELQAALSNEDKLLTVDLTGVQIKSLLEQQWRDNSERPVVALGLPQNTYYFYDHKAAMGEKVQAVWVGNSEVDLTDSTTTYRVITSKALLAGDNGFTVLNEGSNRADHDWSTFAAVKGGLQVWSSVGATEVFVNRKQTSLAISGPRVVNPGKEVTFEVASWSMTNPEAQSEEINLMTTMGVNIANIKLDNTITDNQAETGTATFTFTIPEDALGEQTLTFTDLVNYAEINILVEEAKDNDDNEDSEDSGSNNTDGSDDTNEPDDDNDSSSSGNLDSQNSGGKAPQENTDTNTGNSKDKQTADNKSQTTPLKLNKAEAKQQGSKQQGSKHQGRAKLSNTGFAGAGFAAAAVGMIIAGTMAIAMPRRRR